LEDKMGTPIGKWKGDRWAGRQTDRQNTNDTQIQHIKVMYVTL